MPMPVFRAAAVALLLLSATSCGFGRRMSFFVTSTRTGDGGNIGGLEGADAHCRTLAAAAGSPTREWYAYLSAAADGGRPAVNARDRIGQGPWFNAKGVRVAANLNDLHGPGNQLGGRTSLDEHGNFVLSHVHDILTGSNPDGTLADGDSTCQNWTSTEGKAMVGHSNKVGGKGLTRVSAISG